jgi:CheY-like chemotaxis protein
MLANPNIFYADDDVEDVEFFRDALAQIDSSLVLTASNDGDELLDRLQSPPPTPHLIFLDLNMPRKNGFEVLSEIRSNESLSHYPVIIFSTTTDQDAIAKTRQLGANRFVSKPSSFNGMKKVIRTCLETDWPVFKAQPENYALM